MQVQIIDLGTLDTENWNRGRHAALNEFQHDWTRKLLQRAIRQERQEVTAKESRETAEAQPRTARAETTLIALLQVGRPITVEAAATLLHHQWAGSIQLENFYYSRAADWDEETQRNWADALRMRQYPSAER